VTNSQIMYYWKRSEVHVQHNVTSARIERAFIVAGLKCSEREEYRLKDNISELLVPAKSSKDSF